MATSKSGTTALFWFRRDLRLSDNRALVEAVAAYERVVPVFIWDPVLLGATGPARLRFLAECVAYLQQACGGNLATLRGDPAQELPMAAEKVGATAVYATADFGPYGRRRDETAAELLATQGCPLKFVDSNYAVEPGTLVTAQGSPFQVFSPFSRAWFGHGWDKPHRRPDLGSLGDGGLGQVEAPAVAGGPAVLPAAGEEAAHRALERFLRAPVDKYKQGRDRPDLDFTSRLSAYLRFGCIHPRQILSRLEPHHPSHDTYAKELCWREFYADVLWHRPDAARQSYREEWRTFRVDEGAEADRRFEAWAQGRTGYPIVDAGMRQLLGEGWMHNRVRMIVASFLVKDLHVDWGRGARWFMTHLVDGDLASNQLNWQWVAGSGTDAAPYFRVFNPVSQGQRFDPDGTYIRRWVPELRDMEDGFVHEPWKADISLFGDESGYPRPIVDHAVEREEALQRYSQVRQRR